MSKESELALSLRAQRLLIGWLGALLPIALCMVAALRPTTGFPLRDSVSAYYYSGAGTIFVGVLCALSVTLVTYRGYSDTSLDRWLGIVGGICAFCVAFFPTSPPCDPATAPPTCSIFAPDWWTETMHRIHLGSAISLFAIFFVFATFLFTRSNQDPAGWDADKRWRNRVCYLGGALIAIGIGLALYQFSVAKGPVYWGEVLAIEGFALSWLAKASAHAPVVRLVNRIVH